MEYLGPILEGIQTDVTTALNEIKRLDEMLRGDREGQNIGLIASQKALADRVGANARALGKLERIDKTIEEAIQNAIEKHQDTIQFRLDTGRFEGMATRIAKQIAAEKIAEYEVRLDAARKASEEEEEKHPRNPIKALLKNPVLQAVLVYIALQLSEGFIGVLWTGLKEIIRNIP